MFMSFSRARAAAYDLRVLYKQERVLPDYNMRPIELLGWSRLSYPISLTLKSTGGSFQEALRPKKGTNHLFIRTIREKRGTFIQNCP
jgi:hypothetical protein